MSSHQGQNIEVSILFSPSRADHLETDGPSCRRLQPGPLLSESRDAKLYPRKLELLYRGGGHHMRVTQG